MSKLTLQVCEVLDAHEIPNQLNEVVAKLLERADKYWQLQSATGDNVTCSIVAFSASPNV